MNKHNQFVTVWMFIGMLFGLAIGYIIGRSQGNVGITMCFGIVFGMIVEIGVGTVIKKLKEKR